jgi:hypothetical protein
VGALDRAGVSVADLAADKEVDLRTFSSCWLSRAIGRPDLHFKRILCFEPRYRGRPPEVVGDIFRSIFPFAGGGLSMTELAMPNLASGDQGEDAEVMLEAQAEAAAHWLAHGLPLKRIKIVVRDTSDSPSRREAFARVRRRFEAQQQPRARDYRFDVFVSYSHVDKDAIDTLVELLGAHRPGLRIFVDRLELKLGAAWQQHIFESLDASRKVVCVFSPDYVASKVCLEEYNMALLRHRETDAGVLLPVYLRTAGLPTYMRLVQYEDAREGDPLRVAQAAERLVDVL